MALSVCNIEEERCSFSRDKSDPRPELNLGLMFLALAFELDPKIFRNEGRELDTVVDGKAWEVSDSLDPEDRIEDARVVRGRGSGIRGAGPQSLRGTEEERSEDCFLFFRSPTFWREGSVQDTSNIVSS